MSYKNSENSESVITQNNSQQNSTLSVNHTADNMSACNCGCGFEVGSPKFIALHVESQDEQEQREAIDQYNAEQNAQAYYYANMPEPHSSTCNCVECN